MLLIIILCSYLLWSYVLLYYVSRRGFPSDGVSRAAIFLSVVLSPLCLFLVIPVLFFGFLKWLFVGSGGGNGSVGLVPKSGDGFEDVAAVPSQDDIDKFFDGEEKEGL